MSFINLPNDMKKEILNSLPLEQLGTASQISKEFKLFIDERLTKLAEKIKGLDPTPSIPLRKRLINHINRLKSYINNLPKNELPKKIASLTSKGAFSAEEINLLSEFQKARDTCKVWEQLCQTIGDPLPNIQYSDLNDVLKNQKAFSEWSSKNETRLLKLWKLSLKNMKLKTLPSELEKLKNLCLINLTGNYFETFPLNRDKFPNLSFQLGN